LLQFHSLQTLQEGTDLGIGIKIQFLLKQFIRWR